MAAGLRADWLVVHVERPGELRTDPATREKIVDLLSFAEELGAQTTVLSGHRVSDELLAFARERHVSRILVGKPTRGRAGWRLIAGSLTSTLIRSSGEIDVYVVDTPARPTPAPIRWELSGERSPPPRLPRRAVVVALVHRHRRADGAALRPRQPGDAVPDRRAGQRRAVRARARRSWRRCSASPRSTSSSCRRALTFAVSRHAVPGDVRRDARQRVAGEHAGRSAARAGRGGAPARAADRGARIALSRDLADTRNETELLEAAAARARETLDCRGGAAAARRPGARSARARRPACSSGHEPRESGVAQWVFDHGQPAGHGTATLPSARGLYLPLQTPAGRARRVRDVYPQSGRSFATPRGSMRTLETFANQIALALERSQLATDCRSRAARRGERADAQRPAQLGVARPAHAACGDHRRHHLAAARLGTVGPETSGASCSSPPRTKPPG